MNIPRAADNIMEHTTQDPIKVSHINTHENAIEVLIIVAEQRLEVLHNLYKLKPTAGLEKNIAILERSIAFGHDYLTADGYYKDPDRGLNIFEETQ